MLLPGGEPPRVGDSFKNPDLAAMLEKLAQRGTVESFYKGDIAAQVAAAVRAGGGLVTVADLAAYQARDVEPTSFAWNGMTVHTPPPTAGGATALEALAVLKVLKWDKWDEAMPNWLTGRLEALRLAWDDRLRFFGDPTKVDVRLDRLLSPAHAEDLAAKVRIALRDNKPVPVQADLRPAHGAQHLRALDKNGTMVAVTLTHGGYYGAQVTVDGLGLTLGHGMSRFNTEPGHAGLGHAGKRPLHNLSPTIVTKQGKPVMALGGRGGRKIPNAVFEVLAQYVGRGRSPTAAVAAPGFTPEGGLKVELEKTWPGAAAAKLQGTGYAVTRAAGGIVRAVWFTSDTEAVGGASR